MATRRPAPRKKRRDQDEEVWPMGPQSEALKRGMEISAQLDSVRASARKKTRKKKEDTDE